MQAADLACTVDFRNGLLLFSITNNDYTKATAAFFFHYRESLGPTAQSGFLFIHDYSLTKSQSRSQDFHGM